MNAKEFVQEFKQEKDSQINDYFSNDPKTVTGTIIKKLNLSKAQTELLQEAIDASLTDTYYTILLGLDGSTGIGSMQHTFEIYDEDKNLISECGEIEAEAYEQFHEINNKS